MRNFNNEESLYDLYIVPMSDNENIFALNLANKLRKQGIKVIVEMKKRKIKKCMEWADKNNIDYVSVIGEQEIETNEIEIKDMKNYNSNKLNINDIDKIIELIK